MTATMNPEMQLAAWIKGVLVVIGIGNPLRGDDGAGSLVARRIADWPGASVIDAQDVPEDYLQLVVNQQPDTIVLIDSVDMGSEPGSVVLLHRDQFAGYWPSTHRVPISLLMSFLEHETHARVFAIGIQPAHTELLAPMSDPVAASIQQVADMLNRVLAECQTAAQEASVGHWRGDVPA